jgi:organic radical activating enzyme
LTDYYCNQKFYWLTVEPERRSVASCCAATPHKVNLEWLRDNPTQLFNTPELVQDRELMLANMPASSCEDTCWRAESAGLPSRRTTMKSEFRSMLDTHCDPTVLHINLGSDCNLTCSYCCKQYSTAWLRDVNDNGLYLDETRYRINANDRIVLQLGQSAIKTSSAYQAILDATKHYRNLVEIEISGGEPFLYNGLLELVAQFDCDVNIFTGLGVDTNRLTRIADQLPSNVKITVSAETTGALYEFNRYGNTWSQFQRNLDVIAKRFDYAFCSVISNLTIHGYADFERVYGGQGIITNFCTDPDYLSASVLDAESKKHLQNQTYKYHDRLIKETLATKCTDTQTQNLKKYILEFAQRRNLKLDIFPESFVNWIITTEETIA